MRTYSIGEVSRFFGKSVHWVRWMERETDHFGGMEDRRTKGGHRYYYSEDVVAMATYLYRGGKITAQTLQLIINEVSK